MFRAQRLLDLIQILRSHRFPVSGACLAAGLGISLRILYRDIETLRKQGANIDGEPGMGYVLQPGFMLPPLMFSEDEIEALVLGACWVANRGDQWLAAAARSAVNKIAAVLLNDLRHILEASALLAVPSDAEQVLVGDAGLAQIRRAIRTERKIEIAYRDAEGIDSRRMVWPFALGYFDEVSVLAAWCELRQSFRHFRTDRIHVLTVTDECYPRRRQMLLKEWREIEKIPLQ